MHFWSCGDSDGIALSVHMLVLQVVNTFPMTVSQNGEADLVRKPNGSPELQDKAFVQISGHSQVQA